MDIALIAISLEHDNYQLYPVAAEDKEQIQSLRTAAALVPSHMLTSESEDQ